MRALFMSTAERGHLHPMLGVLQWLRRDGHDVAWLCIPEPTPVLTGIEQLRLEGAPPPPPLVTHGEALARLVRDPLVLRDWIKTLLLDAVPGQVDPVRAALARWRPDVLCTDPMLYQGVIAAHLEGVPWVGISSSLNPAIPEPPPADLDCALLETVRVLSPQRRALFAGYGLELEFRVCDAISPFATTVFATEAFAGELPLPRGAHFVGPSLPPEGRDPAPPLPALDGRVVYASFGSQISWQPEIFAKVAAACAPLDVTLVLSAGALAADTSFVGALPGRVHVASFTPQLELLARTQAFVTHGGANSVMESLWAGVPLLVSPVCNDQPMQAQMIARRGCGIRLDLATATVAEARDALRALLDDPRYREALAPIQRSYRAADGARQAAGIVVSSFWKKPQSSS
jgi:UDP:flavonoid glycosyltransferase YjiC (YdhE family)